MRSDTCLPVAARQAVYTALKETESRATDLLPVWKLPFLAPLVPRQRKALAAVDLIRQTTEQLIARCTNTNTSLQADAQQVDAHQYSAPANQRCRLAVMGQGTKACAVLTATARLGRVRAGARRWWMRRRRSGGRRALRRATSTRRTPPCCASSSPPGTKHALITPIEGPDLRALRLPVGRKQSAAAVHWKHGAAQHAWHLFRATSEEGSLAAVVAAA